MITDPANNYQNLIKFVRKHPDKKRFKIYVVGDDFLRADNTLMSVGTGVFTADGTFIRKPIWITPEDLGIHRANNYLTILLDTYEVPVIGQVVYSLDASNPDSTPPCPILNTKYCYEL